MNQPTPIRIVDRLLKFTGIPRRYPVRCAIGLLGTGLVVLGYAAGIGSVERVENGALTLPLSPPSSTAWTVENAFPGLTFFEPTCVVRDETSDQVFVLERRGTVQVFDAAAANPQKRQVLDLSDQVWRTPFEDDGAMGLVLHPEFGVAGSPHGADLFVFYTAKSEGQRFDRLVRFTLGPERTGESVLIDQLDDNIWHNGGALAFGPDGFLYVGVGDEGTDGDGLGNGQRLDRDFFCGILRIDVDRRGGEISHPPLRQPASGRTANYFVPNDNPFVGVPGVLEEFWAHGLRNPFRIAFDQTGQLWAADVGHLRREEINLIEKGGNYGWSYREGGLPFTESYLQGAKPDPYLGIEKAPYREYPHINGDNCIIGGFVYRGEQYPELAGKYLYGDNGSGRLWALASADGSAAENVELLSLPVSSKTGVSAIVEGSQGEPWIVVLGAADTTSGTIQRVIRAERGSAGSLPPTLSATGIFSDTAALTPSEGLLEYGINAGQSVIDGVSVRRWLMLPGDGTDPEPEADRIGYSSSGPWRFPTGTVFVQHFERDATIESAPRRLETRILVRHAAGGVYGVTYRWNHQGTDAELLNEPISEPLENQADTISSQQWHYLSGQTCLACHNQNAGFVLGVNARQLKRSFRTNGSLIQRDQLRFWSRLGMFREPLTEADMKASNRLVDPHDETADLGLRARSFLDVNCAACHRPGGARANFYAGFEQTATADFAAGLPKQGDFGIADARLIVPGDPYSSVLYYRMAKLGPGRMPFVASQRLDIPALELVRRWIEQHPDARPHSPEQDHATRLYSTIERGQPDELVELLSDTRRGFRVWQAALDGELGEPQYSKVVETAIRSPNAAVRDLFEWLVPPAERTQRLGTQFDPTDVLVLSGDAGRGRAIFERLEGLDCKSCHGLQPTQRLVGPSLWGIGDKYDRSQLLEHVVDPHRKIDPEFSSWMLETSSGRIHTGLKIEETDTQVVLKESTGKEIRVPLDEVEFLERSEQSLMPENLLQSLTAQQAADLLSFLQSLRKGGDTL